MSGTVFRGAATRSDWSSSEPFVDTAGMDTDALGAFVLEHVGDSSGDHLVSRTMLYAFASRLLLADEVSTEMTEVDIGEEILKLLAYAFEGAPGYDPAWSPIPEEG
jgi:hypothetical protein